MKIRKLFESFEAYGWEIPSREIAAEVGLRPDQIIRLDTNTSPFSPVAELVQLSARATDLPVNEYPDTSYFKLASGLARYCEKGPERFVVTNGADEGLDIISKTILDPDDQVVVPMPTYSMFRIVSELMGAKVRYLSREPDFSLLPDVVLSVAARERTKLIFLCNPNSPTGNVMPIEHVEKVVRGTEATVAIDEAYSEFSGKSSMDLTDKYDNVIVCRTFSKAFSMAGVRVGYLVAKGETVEKLNLVRPPNSLSVVSLMLAEMALDNLEEMRANVKRIVSERERVARALQNIDGIEPYPSETNFILFRLKRGDATRVHHALVEKGYVLRNVSGMAGAEDCLRVTISTPGINDGFLSNLGKVLVAGSR